MRLLVGLLALAVAAGCRPADPPLTPLPGAAPFAPELARRIGAAARERDRRDQPRTRHLGPDGRPRYTNRLILESSPYLLQHAHNPVVWHPWGDEAFATAREQRRPVLLSIGYSTCHWCHVMEEESYEDEEIAAYLNEHFVAIKVDREERPDVDGVYMEAVQAMTGSGGWPLNVWLTPERQPFYGGTYFPPRDGARGARTGFLTLLRTLADVYGREPARAASAAADVVARLASAGGGAGGMPDAGAIRAAVASLAAGFDATWGGFGRAPKFPRPATLELLLRHHRRTGDQRSLVMVTTTLERMAAGGIHDQLGGGFHRYATDAEWHVPHFEKMLYDNAQLAAVSLEAFQATGRADFAGVARDTLDWVAADMAAPEGGFYSATDADSPGGEGAYFRWTPVEIDGVIGAAPGRLVQAYFGVDDEGILWRPRPLADAAAAAGVAPEAMADAVAAARPALLAARARREPPATDRKVLVAWNGLMVSAFARGALVLDDPGYLAIARRAAARVADSGPLRHAIVDGRAAGDPFLDDYAFVIAGLLDLFEADADPRWLAQAIALQEALDAEFADRDGGGYFFTAAGHEPLLKRAKPDDDGALPAGNSVAALNLLRLAEYTDDARYRARAEGTLRAFRPVLARSPAALPRLLVALDFLLDRPKQVVIVAPEDGDAAALLATLRQRFVPNRVMVSAPESRLGALARFVPVAAEKVALGGRPTAYVCEARRCDLPATDPDVLARQLARVEPLP
jgi:uncharacterized protein YyaL (SSP411 family)